MQSPLFAIEQQPLYEPDLSAYPKVSYCVDPDWLPYEAIRNNRHVGISADYLSFIGVLAEVNFQLLPTSSWQETLDKLKSGECQVASMLNRSPERETYLLFTQPYFVGPNVLVGNSEQTFLQGYENIGKQVVGVVKKYRQAEYLRNYYPHIELLAVDNELAGIRLLSEGKIDLFAGSLLSVNKLLQNEGLADLQIVGIAEPQDQLGMGVANSDYALLTKLNEAIAQLPEWVHADIYRQWTNVKVIESTNYQPLGWLIAAFVGVVLLGLWRQMMVSRFNRQLMAKNKQLQALQKELLDKNRDLEFMSMRDPLTQMYNRHYMQNRLEQERQLSQRKNLPVCLMLIDIDYFKKVNDKFGHLVGDQVLLEMADCINDTIRDMDVAARWGGEEFLVLCPKTTLGEAVYLAKRLRQTIKQRDFSGVGKLTCSFGVSQYSAAQNFVEWFEATDKALYAAKDGGRDKIEVANAVPATSGDFDI